MNICTELQTSNMRKLVMIVQMKNQDLSIVDQLIISYIPVS